MVEQLEVILHSLANIFVDDLGILPSPFRIEAGIADQVKGGLLAQIGLLSGFAHKQPRTTAGRTIKLLLM